MTKQRVLIYMFGCFEMGYFFSIFSHVGEMPHPILALATLIITAIVIIETFVKLNVYKK